MRIFLVNFVLYLIRLVRLDWRWMRRCIVDGERLCQVWEIKTGDIFRMEDDFEVLIAISGPVVCWRTGIWGIMSLPITGEWQTPDGELNGEVIPP